MFIGKGLRSYIKARDGSKEKKEAQERMRPGEEKTGFGLLHVVKREEELVMLPGVDH